MATNKYSYRGKDLDVKWVDGSGTATLTGNQRSFEYTPSIDLIDQSAGSDTNKTYITGLKDGKATFNALFQSGVNAGGTITFSRCAEGTEGTIIWSPEGTASGKPKITMPAISMGAGQTIPYDGLVEVKVEFQQNGTRVEGSN